MFGDGTRYYTTKIVCSFAMQLLMHQFSVIREDPALTDFVRFHIRMLAFRTENRVPWEDKKSTGFYISPLYRYDQVICPFAPSAGGSDC
jgi:hypothetical protein